MKDPVEFPELPILSTSAANAADGAHRLPRWLKRQVPLGNSDHRTARTLDELGLETVCDNAKCPNRMECYSQNTATVMILGNICTRACSFCAVPRGTPEPLADDEPQRVADAVRRLGLQYVVITSVTRDDLCDGGASHYVRCIRAVRHQTGAAIEVLTPDFIRSPNALEQIVRARPDVFSHNTETVPRLYRQVRGVQSEYPWTLELLRRVKRQDSRIWTKSGLMLGLGESRQELMDVLGDLLNAGCDFLTLGQYLRPNVSRYMPVVRYLPPEEFTELGIVAKEMGFKQVASGPFVRSSYRARGMISRAPGNVETASHGSSSTP